MANRAVLKSVPFRVGDTIRVYQRIKEGEKERLQAFEGVVIMIHGHQDGKSFTVRKIATGAVGVERIWPLNSPWINRIQVVRQGKVKRAKLYYLRKRVGKQALKVQERLVGEVKERADKKQTKAPAKAKVNADHQTKPRVLRRAAGKKATSK